MSATEVLLNSELDLAWQNIFKRDTSAAMAHAKKASTIANDSPEVAHVLGVIASRDGRSDLALPLLQKALNGGVTERRLRDMAEALVLAKHPEAAIAPINDAIKQFGASAESLGLLAAIYVALEKYDEASQAAQQAVALKPGTLAWETTIGFCDLIRGQFKDGLKAFTFRPQTMTEGGRCPALQLGNPGDLWLKNEQGPGDTLFFLCHASALVERGWRLHVQSHIRTQKLLEETGLFAEVSLGFNCPQDGFWINIGDLPLAASQLSLPAVSTPLPLKAQDKLVGKVAKLLQKFGPPPYVAVTWRGGVQGSKVRNGVRMGDRYIDTYQFGETLKNINASVISVQRVPDSKEAKAFEAGLGRKFLDLSRLNDNLPEMLALLEIVDDYIAVPNTNHHLREALGKPTKIIVNRPYEDWRWAHEGDSPWYPNATCYRQAPDGNLAAVFKKISADLISTFTNTKTADVQHVATDADDSGEDNNASQIQELLQAGWKSVGANDVPTGIKYAQQVMAISPDNASAFHLLGWAAMRDLKLDLAVSVLKRATELDSTDGRIAGDYIRALSANQQHNLAIEVATAALNNPSTHNRSSIYYGRAACYLSSNRLKEAVEDYQSCISINPNRLDAQEYSGMARLKLGDATNGFRELTARKVAQRDELLNDWCCPVLTYAHQGARVLIKRDMGLGDELTYLRYLPWLTAAGIKVDYWAGNKLVPVLERMGYLNHVYPDSQKAPENSDYDLSFIVNDLPVAAYGLGAPEIAPPLPLTPRPDLIDKWKAWLQSLGQGPYIGLNWKAGLGIQGAGNIFSKLAKAVDAEPFAKALAPIGATWICLQRNVLSDELGQFQQYLQAPLHDAVSMTDDIEDLLALLSLLDENIGVSNTNMHLRASLGLGSRVMVQAPGGDWRWGAAGNQTVWFTESIVYRQADDGSWKAPLATLQQDMETLYGARSASVTVSATPITTQPLHVTASTKRIIWLTAGAIKIIDGKQTSDLASARYRVIAPSQALKALGWQSEIVNEEVSQVMGGWGSAVPQAGDLVIVSKVFTDHTLKLMGDAKQRGAKIVVDFCDNFLHHPKRGPLQHALLKLADKVVTSTHVLNEALTQAGRTADAVISDPVEMPKGNIQFSPQQPLKLVWFGHAVNIDTLAQWLPSLAAFATKQAVSLNVVTTLPNGKADLDKIVPAGLSVHYTPWSIEATQQAIQACDIVVIPTLSSDMKASKSPNRLLEPLWAGRMVVAGILPSYLHFADSAWVGKDLIEGVAWCVDNPNEVLKRIAQGQHDIQTYFTPAAIGQSWQQILEQTAKPMSTTTANNMATTQPTQTSALTPYIQPKEVARLLGLANASAQDASAKYQALYPVKYDKKPSKIAVYTAIFGGYDTAPVLNHIDPQLDYILYTDDPQFKAPLPWQVRVVPSIFKDPQVDARRIKVLSHLFLVDYDIAVWIDGNFSLGKVSVELVQDIASRAPVALCKHQFRNCIYDEAIEILKRGIDASTPVLKQIQYYQARHFPAQFGLHATGFLLRNHQDSQTIKMNMRWWELLSTNSKRDQLSFDYVRWETNTPIMALPFNQRDNQLFEWGKNGERKHNLDVRKNDEHDGRALNHNPLTTIVDMQLQYQPLFDSWHGVFLNDVYALNQCLLSTSNELASSILYDGVKSAECLPDPRFGDLQRSLLNKLCQAKRILQIGFDGGHIALMAIHYSGAKVVVVDERLDEYKHAGTDYLAKLHAKRFATFSQQGIMQLDEAVFDLVCINTVEASQYQEIIHKLKQLSKSTVFIEFSYSHSGVQNVSPKAAKSHQSALIDDNNYTKSTYGMWLKNRQGDLTWRFAIQGKYGFFYADWLKKQKESIFIDIGANIGLYSLIASTNYNFKAIYSFEPHPETYQYLVDNIKVNHASNCMPHRLAISDKCEKQTIHVKPNHSGVATLREVKSSEGYQSSIEIECIDAAALDVLIQNPNSYPISIKIDVEGFELVVIQTLLKTSFWPQVTNIYYEVDENYLDYKSVEAILLKEGFRFEAKNGDADHYDLLFIRDEF